MNNTDKIIDHLLKNINDLPATKIKALGEVVGALSGEKLNEPNDVPVFNDPNLVDENQPLDLSKVKGMTVDGKSHPIKIYNN